MIEFKDASFGARPSVFVKGLRVIATHLGYRKTVKGLAKVNAKQHRFHCAEFNKVVTVEEYFARSKSQTCNLSYRSDPLHRVQSPAQAPRDPAGQRWLNEG